MLANLGAFLLYFGTALVLLAAFLALYMLVTPARDLERIRAGDTATALTLGGAVVGFCLPLAMAIARSLGLADMVAWAAVALVVQLLCHLAVRRLRHHPDHPGGDMAEAVLMASASIGLGIVNAACLT